MSGTSYVLAVLVAARAAGLENILSRNKALRLYTG
jgi:hypothetical protein